MKKPVFVSILVLLAVFLTASACFSMVYTITRISDNRFLTNTDPQINDKGQVAWVGHGEVWEILLHDGTGITTISDSGIIGNKAPRINSKGQVIWVGLVGTDTEIFLHDGTTITQLSDDRSTSNDYPQINASGQVVWRGWDGTDTEIFLYDGTTITKLSDDRSTHNEYPQINASGQVVWQGHVGPADDDIAIFLYDGTTITQLSDGRSTYNIDPQINASGQVVWSGLADTKFEIFLHDGTTITQLSDGRATVNAFPQINSRGQVVWSGDVGYGNWKIFFYDGTNVIQISDFLMSSLNAAPKINSMGQIVWEGRDWMDQEIFVSDRGTFTQLTINDVHDAFPQINEKGQVVWEGMDGMGVSVFLATPNPISVPITNTPSGYPVVDRPSRYPIINAPSDAPVTTAPSGTPPDLGRRIEIIDYCKTHPRECIWREYMVFDPPLPAPVRMGYRPLGSGMQGMEAARCPECSFSRSWYPQYMPKEVIELYDAGQTYIEEGRTPETLEGITALIKDAPVGERFTKKAKESALGNLKKPVSEKADTSRETLYAAINAMDLDWRVPPLEAQKLEAGKNAKADFQGVATVRFGKVEKSGKVALKVESGMPAVAEGFEPGRPLASYAFDYRGKGSGDMNVSIYFGGMDFTGDPSSLRLLRWDGKSYTDITTVIDVPNRIITGRTDRLSTFVIMSQSSKPKKDLKHMKQIKYLKHMR